MNNSPYFVHFVYSSILTDIHLNTVKGGKGRIEREPRATPAAQL